MSDAELTSLFAKLPADSIVRTWFFQQQAINTATHRRDWSALDRVTRLADAYHIKLVASLAGGGGCDNGLPAHDIRWYLNTVPNRLDGNRADAGHSRNGGWGADLTSYDTWVTEVVSRYRNNSAIAIWEPFSEAEADRPDGSCDQTAGNVALVGFFSEIGDMIHYLDGNHLVGSGLMGNGACGTNGVTNYQNLASLPGLDVMSVHLYQPIGDPPVPNYMASDIAGTAKPTSSGNWASGRPPTSRSHARTARTPKSGHGISPGRLPPSSPPVSQPSSHGTTGAARTTRARSTST